MRLKLCSIFLSLLFCAFNLNLNAQANIEWERNFGGSNGETAYSIQQTTDGGYVVAGTTSSIDGDVSGNNGGGDFWITKLDSLGNLEWEKNYGGSNNDNAYSMQQTSDGGYIVAGTTESNDGDVGPSNASFGLPDYWVIRLDTSGSLLWEQNFGGSSTDVIFSVRQTSDDGYILAGGSASNDSVESNNGSFDYWIVKLNSTGSFQWQKNYGGSNFEWAQSIAQTTDGGYIVAGESLSNDFDVGGNNGSTDYWIVKLDASGNLLWQKNYGGSNSDSGKSIQQTTDGGYIIQGVSNSSDFDVSGNNGDFDYWIIKLNSSGGLQWQKNYGGPADEGSQGAIGRDHNIIQTLDGGYIIADHSYSNDGDVGGNNGGADYWIIKLDALGELEWEENFGGSGNDNAHSIFQTMDGAYVIAGDSDSAGSGDVGGNNGNGNNGVSDFWIIKISPLENDCFTAKTLPLNNDPCSNHGAVVDFQNLTASDQVLSPACGGVFPNTLIDAWYKVTVPPSGNFLIRANGNNTIAPVIAAYLGDCDALIENTCQGIDSVPYTIVFENYIPGSKIYLAVWDRENTIVNSGAEAILSISGHTLSSNPNEWEICDYNNYLLTGNPTNLSNRDLNSYILEFEVDAPPDSIQVWQQEAEQLGDILRDECTCGGRVLQLWGVSNPIELEERTESAEDRADVDTSSYNFHFEDIEFQVNSYSPGEQSQVDVAMDPAGNFVMVWTDIHREHNYGRLYNSSGNPVTPEFQIGVSNNEQLSSSVAIQDNGDFVVVWIEKDPSLNYLNQTIWGRLFHADATPNGPPFDISLTAAQNISSDPDTLAKYAYGKAPEVAVDANGNFVVLWQLGNNIFFQMFDNLANPLGNIQTVNAEWGNNPTIPDPAFNSATPSNAKIAMNSSGEFVIAWNGATPASLTELDIYARRYDNLGNPVLSTFQVNTYPLNKQKHPDLVLANDGTLTMTWQSFGQDGDKNGIYWRQFNGANSPINGIEQKANTIVSEEQLSPGVGLFDDGSFNLSWGSYHDHPSDLSDYNIYARLYNSNGIPFNNDPEFLVNQIKDFEQKNPKVATNGNTVFITAWVDRNNDTNYEGIFAQRYEVLSSNGNIVDFYPIGTATPSTLLGTELTHPQTIYTPTDFIANVRVAIIDTGVDADHPFLSSAIWNNQEVNDNDNCQEGDLIGYDFVNEIGDPNDLDGHGTKVNGIVSRAFNTDLFLEMMNLKFHELDKGKVFDAVCAIYYAVDNGANILNLSWGFEASEFPAILNDALQYASDNDVLIITSAGNTSKDNDVINKYPANLDILNMIVVTSYTYDDTSGEIELSNYASYGANNVDIAAYGFVETSTLGNGLVLTAGTSLAAPAVTHTAATIKGLYPTLTASEIKNCILSTAQYQANLDGKVLTNGILDHAAAIECARIQAGDCIAIDLYISVPQVIDSVYRTNAYIGSNATLTDTVKVEYLAADSILLDEDFCVLPGAEFLADIEDCGPLNPIAKNELDKIFRIREHSPLSGKIIAKFQAKRGKEVTIQIKDATHKILDEWTSNIQKDGVFEKILNVHALPEGIFYIEFIHDELQIEKIIQLGN